MSELKIVQVYILKQHNGKLDGKRRLREMTAAEREECLVFEKAEEIPTENQVLQTAKDTLNQIFGTGPKYSKKQDKAS